MKKFLVILVCSFCLLLGLSAEAKIYTNDEYQFSIWVPDGMNLYEDNSGQVKDVKIFKGMAYGINLLLMVSRDLNEQGDPFNSLAVTQKILQTNKECFEGLGFIVKTYYKNPCPNHYYPITLNYSPEQNFISCSTQITIHGYSVSIIANGAYQQIKVVQNIVDSFTCLQETGGL